ncbi:MAG: hypothetical protein ACE5JI_21995 [Acidobacteriota bacterium]
MPLSDLIPQYYVLTEGDHLQTFAPGQLYWAPTFFLPPHPEVLFEVNPDPTEQRLQFEIRRADQQSFAGAHRPLKSINFQATEELIAVKAKKRLVALLSEPNVILEDLRPAVAKDRKIHERSFLSVPLYGVHRVSGERGFPALVVRRVQALMYNQFFYFPPSSDEPDAVIYEAIGRLDRIQAFHQDTLRAGATRFRLHPDCLEVFREWARGYLTGTISEYVRDLRTELIKELYT